MRQNRPVRIVKREQKEQARSVNAQARPRETESSERELRTVVSGWVSEHRRRTEEFRQNYSTLLRNAGMLLPRAT